MIHFNYYFYAAIADTHELWYTWSLLLCYLSCDFKVTLQVAHTMPYLFRQNFAAHSTLSFNETLQASSCPNSFDAFWLHQYVVNITGAPPYVGENHRDQCSYPCRDEQSTNAVLDFNLRLPALHSHTDHGTLHLLPTLQRPSDCLLIAIATHPQRRGGRQQALSPGFVYLWQPWPRHLYVFSLWTRQNINVCRSEVVF